MTNDSEKLLTPALVDACVRRDPEGLVDLYKALGGPVYAYLLRQTRDAHWADDLTGEVFCEVIQAIERFTGTPDRLRAWVFRIARNTLIDHIRRESRRRHESLDVNPQMAERPEFRIDAESEAMANVGLDRILGFVHQLPPDQREVILLRLVSDLPLADVAYLVDKSVGAVKALQHRALKRLAREMGDERDTVRARLALVPALLDPDMTSADALFEELEAAYPGEPVER